VEAADTDIAPFGLGTWGDRGTFIGGSAVKLAAADARKQLFEIAAQILQADESEVQCEEGKIYVEGSAQKALLFEEVASAAVYRKAGAPTTGKGTFIPNSEPFDETHYGNISGTYAFGAHAAEVEVNEETGVIRVLKLVAAHDVGRALNPNTVEGQIEGGMAQGMGYALLEDVQYKNGVMLTSSFLNYHIPTALDMPPIHPMIVETIDPSGPFGAKGVAEPALNPTPPAIANAIYDAVGVRIKSLPITPQKVLRAMRRKRG
jgi:CO/xanthine dehydrogenase Mo-binding subunit